MHSSLSNSKYTQYHNLQNIPKCFAGKKVKQKTSEQPLLNFQNKRERISRIEFLLLQLSLVQFSQKHLVRQDKNM